jgi:hypothetical protein
MLGECRSITLSLLFTLALLLNRRARALPPALSFLAVTCILALAFNALALLALLALLPSVRLIARYALALFHDPRFTRSNISSSLAQLALF